MGCGPLPCLKGATGGPVMRLGGLGGKDHLKVQASLVESLSRLKSKLHITPMKKSTGPNPGHSVAKYIRVTNYSTLLCISKQEANKDYDIAIMNYDNSNSQLYLIKKFIMTEEMRFLTRTSL